MPEPMSDERLAEIQAREEAATEGPWHVAGPPWNHDSPYVIAGNEDPHFGKFIADVLSVGTDPDELTDEEREQNAVFIAHARQDVPALLAEVKRLREELADMEGLASDLGVVRLQLQGERDHYRERLAEQDHGATILALEETIAAADADRDRLEQQLRATRAELQGAYAGAAELRRMYGDIKAERDRLDAEVERLHSKLAAETARAEANFASFNDLTRRVCATRLGRELARADKAEAERDRLAEQVRDVLDAARWGLTTSADDWGATSGKAWIYGIFVGWGCEEDHECNEVCDGDGALADVVASLRWKQDRAARLVALRATVRALDGEEATDD